MLGMIAIRFGTLILILGFLSRARDRSRVILNWLLLYLFMSMMAISLGVFQEYTIRPNMHSARFYALVSMTIPLWLATIAGASGKRWACTWVGVLYTADYLAFIWDPSPVRGRAQTGARVSSRHAVRPTGFSAAADRACCRPRPRAAETRDLVQMAAGGGGRDGFSSGLPGRAVAVRQFPPVARRAQLVLRNQIHSLLRAVHYGLCALRLHDCGTEPPAVLAQAGFCVSRGSDDDPAGIGLGAKACGSCGASSVRQRSKPCRIRNSRPCAGAWLCLAS